MCLYGAVSSSLCGESGALPHQKNVAKALFIQKWSRVCICCWLGNARHTRQMTLRQLHKVLTCQTKLVLFVFSPCSLPALLCSLYLQCHIFFFLPLRDFRHTTFNWNLWIIFFRCRQEKIWNHTALLSTPLQEKNPNNHPRKLRIWEQARQLTPDACDAARQEIFPAFEGV